MKYSHIVAFFMLSFLVCSNEMGQGHCNKTNYEIKSVSIRLNNSLSTFENSDYIDNKVSGFMRQWELKGVSLAIVKDGRLVFAKGYGDADEKNAKQVNPSNIFRLASVSKLITATSIMKLKEEGKLNLDDKVFGKNGILNDSVYLDYTDKKYEKISIEHLLRHEAGFSARIKDPLFLPVYVAEKMKVKAPADTESTIHFQLKQRLSYTPGEHSIYSNLGYVILSKVIEKITGLPYEEYVKTFILAPCGVYDMHIAHNFPEEKYDNEVCYYEQNGTEKIVACDGSAKEVYKCEGGNNVRGLLGAGGWVGSAAELLKFTSCIDGDTIKPDIISTESVEYMTKQIKGKFPIGWMKIDKDHNWWRTGTLAGSTILLKKMENGISWVLVANTSSWKGSKFPVAINGVMNMVIKKIDNWPEYDLFNYFYHNPLVLNIENAETPNNFSS